MNETRLETIIVTRFGAVVQITLNRPKALNAINQKLTREVLDTLAQFDRDPDVGCFVITGNERAFAAGADIPEMAPHSYMDHYHADLFADWDQFTAFRTPKIAAVGGYALGGGCELAMMCDMIFAARSALFGQPEIKLGVIPGMGGSQRMTRAIGKSKSMDMILTGRMMDSDEAERSGIVARVIDDADLLPETLKAAEKIAGYGRASVMLAREAVERAEEGGLREGLLFERRIFQSLFATDDQTEGMAAFSEKRSASFTGK